MRKREAGLEKLLNEQNASELGYFNTATEILHQPRMWQETYKCVMNSAKELKDFMGDQPRLIFCGAGSSHFVGVSVAPALRKVFPYAEAISSTEIVMDPLTAFPKEEFILISFARSGNSPEGSAVIALAEQINPGAVKHLAITCNEKGELASLVNGLGHRGFVITLPEGTNDKGLAMTSSFTSMVLAGLLLKFVYTEEQSKAKEYVDSLVQVGGDFIANFDEISEKLSKELHERVYFISSRPYFGGAHEASLKVQEMSGGDIVAYASDTLGLRHGFMAAINDESLIIFMTSSNSYRKKYETDLLKEISAKKLGKKVVLIADDKNDFENQADIIVELGKSNNLPDEFKSIINVIAGQLFGFYASIAHGLDPDSPSPKGIIKRVVEGIIIHPYLQNKELNND